MELSNASHDAIVDELAEAYETKWTVGGDLTIDEFLPTNEPIRSSVLWELLLVDLELRLKAGLEPRVESYLNDFPEIKNQPQPLAKFIQAEFQLRSRREPGLDSNEYRARFPDVELSFLDHFPEQEAHQNEQQRGRYRLTRPFDEGGLGKIWIAKDEEFSREVALKEIKNRYADDEPSRRRFEQEALVTGKLQHPGIVPVYSRGRHFDGRPFYTMQLIDGVSFKAAIGAFHKTNRAGRYGDSRAIAKRRLLSQLADVCKTVHFAHLRGVLHRDIKPSNIMVGDEGGTFLIDWGLARVHGELASPERFIESDAQAIARDGSEISTALGRALGSPAYMSPEQARGDHDQVDERSDVYSLGATLFTVLTNEPPFQGLDTQSILAKVSAGTEQPPRAVNSRIPRKLDAICRKAMHADQSQRYESASELGHDIERYLADEPILATSDTLLEKTRRFSRRHQAVATLLLMTPVAIALAAVLSLGSIRREHAATERVKGSVDYVLQKIGDTFDQTSPAVGGRDILLSEALPIAVDSALQDTDGDSVGRAIFLTRASTALNNLGKYDIALQSSTAAVDLFEHELGPENQQTIYASNERGRALVSLDQIEEAYATLDPALSIAKRKLGDDSPLTQSLEQNLLNAAVLSGRVSEAIPRLKELAKRRSLRPDGKKSLAAQTTEVAALAKQRKFAEAEQQARDLILLGTKQLGPDHPEVLSLQNTLAYVMRYTDRLKSSIRLYQQTLQQRTTILGPRHENSLITMRNLGVALQEDGQLEEAGEHLETAYDIQVEEFGCHHRETLTTLNDLAIFYGRDLGEVERAIELFRTAHAACADRFGESSREALLYLLNISGAKEEIDLEASLVAAEELARCTDGYAEEGPIKDFIRFQADKTLARLHTKLGNGGAAIAAAQRIIDSQKENRNQSQTLLARLIQCEGALLENQVEDAQLSLDHVVDFENEKLADWIEAKRCVLAGAVLRRQGETEAARTSLETGYELVFDNLGPQEQNLFYFAQFAALEMVATLEALGEQTADWQAVAESWDSPTHPGYLEDGTKKADE
jgi:serine/threonine protein kinase